MKYVLRHNRLFIWLNFMWCLQTRNVQTGLFAKYETWREDTIRRNSNQLLERVLENGEAQAFVSAYNATPATVSKGSRQGFDMVFSTGTVDVSCLDFWELHR